jgi:hypothetical protein
LCCISSRLPTKTNTSRRIERASWTLDAVVIKDREGKDLLLERPVLFFGASPLLRSGLEVRLQLSQKPFQLGFLEHVGVVFGLSAKFLDLLLDLLPIACQLSPMDRQSVEICGDLMHILLKSREDGLTHNRDPGRGVRTRAQTARDAHQSAEGEYKRWKKPS